MRRLFSLASVILGYPFEISYGIGLEGIFLNFFKKNLGILLGLLFGAAFLLPTSLPLLWDGLPLSQRPEFIVLLIAMALGFWIFPVWLSGSRFNLNLHKAEFFFFATVLSLLLAVKVFYPKQRAIPTCYAAPFGVGKNVIPPGKCWSLGEDKLNKIGFGPRRRSFTPSLYNSADYNFYFCPDTDKSCIQLKEWKDSHSFPFITRFEIPQSRLNTKTDFTLRYSGSALLLKDGKLIQELPYHAKLSAHSIPLTAFENHPVQVVYRNFGCRISHTEGLCPQDQVFGALPYRIASLFIPLQQTPQETYLTAFGNILIWIFSLGLLAFTLAHLLGQAVPLWKEISSLPLLPWLLNGGLVALLYYTTLRGRPLPEHAFWYLAPSLLVGLLFVAQSFLKAGYDTWPKLTHAVFLVPAACYLFFEWNSLAAFDPLKLMESGNDWLSYSHEAFRMRQTPNWFAHAHYCFAKPLFIYLLAGVGSLLGDGNMYMESLARVALAFCPWLLLFVLSPLARQVKNRQKWLLTVLMGYTFFWSIRSFSEFVLWFPVEMSEIPGWLFSFLAIAALFQLCTSSWQNQKTSRSLWAAALFTFLAGVSRSQSLAAIAVSWGISTAVSKRERRKIFVAGFATFVVFVIVVLLHAYPTLTNDFGGLQAYLGWTTNAKASESFWALIVSTWKKTTFSPQIENSAIFSLLLGSWFVWKERKSRGTSILLFLVSLVGGVATHLSIRDEAYHPRHFIGLAHTFVFVALLLGLLALTRTGSTQRK